MTCVAFSIKFAKTNQKFAENSEFVKIIHYYSKLFTGVLRSRPSTRRSGTRPPWRPTRSPAPGAARAASGTATPLPRGAPEPPPLHRSLISIFSSKIAKKFCEWINEYSLIQSQTLRILHFFCEFLMIFFSGFRAKFQKIVTCVAFSIKFTKTNQKFSENSEFCEKNSLL